MPDNSLTELLNAWFGGAISTLIGALGGRLMYHTGEVRKHNRNFFGWELVWELPIVFGMAMIGETLIVYLDLAQSMSTGVIAALAYMGPRGIETLLSRYFGKPK